MNKIQENMAKAKRYWAEQRKMGEITVAMRLMTDLLRGMPESVELLTAIDNLLRFQKLQARKLRAMEREAGCCWGDL